MNNNNNNNNNICCRNVQFARTRVDNELAITNLIYMK